MDEAEFLQKLREAFAIEAEEHWQALTAGLLELEKAPADAPRTEIVETIFREAHSLKGAARAVNRTDVEAVCQAMESVFAVWKQDRPSFSPETFDVLNAALDLLTRLHARPEVSTAHPDRSAIQEIVQKVSRLTGPAGKRGRPGTGASSAPRRPTSPAPASPPVEPPATAAPSASESAAPVEPTPTAPEAPALPPAPPREIPRLNIEETVRVPTRKMDSLLLQAEELVAIKLLAAEHRRELREALGLLDQWRKEWSKVEGPTGRGTSGVTGKLATFLEWNESQIESLENRLGALNQAAERNERSIGTLIDDLLENAKQLVMLPFAKLLAIFPKQVRDLARSQGKEVEMVIRGSEIEIDKRILEEMKTPLIHLVRNAIDHGLETPAERTRQGKRARARLAIAVSQLDGSKIEILVEDDGAGIDVARVKAEAIKSGLITETEGGQLSEAAALALIFQSGLSTSPILTEISGRGLGMAIVREKIEKLGGQITIETHLHAGTTFRVVLPITLATFKGLLVRAGGQKFVLPIAGIDRIARVPREDIRTIENRETIVLSGQALALTWLADVLELPRREAGDLVEVLVLGVAEQRIGFAVEAVLHEQEVLVKKLRKPLVRVRNLAGATVLGSGTPVLILNVADLLESAVRLSAGGARSPGTAPAVAPVETSRVLVADDSVTSRMLLANILESAGYRVTTAVDGYDALTTLRAGDFAAVVSDVEMPRLDGFDLTAKIRAEKKLADLPVVLVTALGSKEHRERGIDVGANAYLVKTSFDQSNLLETLHKLIG